MPWGRGVPTCAWPRTQGRGGRWAPRARCLAASCTWATHSDTPHGWAPRALHVPPGLALCSPETAAVNAPAPSFKPHVLGAHRGAPRSLPTVCELPGAGHSAVARTQGLVHDGACTLPTEPPPSLTITPAPRLTGHSVSGSREARGMGKPSRHWVDTDPPACPEPQGTRGRRGCGPGGPLSPSCPQGQGQGHLTGRSVPRLPGTDPSKLTGQAE